MVQVVKKDGSLEDFNINKVIKAVSKSAERVLVSFSQQDIEKLCNRVTHNVEKLNSDHVSIMTMHSIVEESLETYFPKVAKSYKDYRDYKQDFVAMLDDVYRKSQSIMYIGDKENANSDSSLVSTKRSLIFNQLNKELYKKFFLNQNESQAIHDGYIYIHDMSARRDTMNSSWRWFRNG